MGTFGFVIHPIGMKDIYRKFPYTKYFPQGLVEKALSWAPPFVASQITGVESAYGKAEGYFVTCPFTPRLIMGLPVETVTAKIISACNKAADLGAKVVGLGALTAVVGDAGITVRENVDIAVTTGNSYTVATAVEATEKAAKAMDIDMNEAGVLVLGASGSIGRALSLILADEGRHLTLCARDLGRLEKAAETVAEETGMVPRVTRNLKAALRESDVVICVSSAIDAMIEPDDLRPGALVCDVSRPRNVSSEVKRKRNDVLIIEGGVVKMPGNVNFNLNFGFPPGTGYACMAETMILALEEHYVDWSIGRQMKVSSVKAIAALAAKHGFEVAGFRSFETAVTEREIQQIKENARKRLSRSA